MSYENKDCPCGGKKETETMLEMHMKIGAMTLRINEEYAGAKAIVTTNEGKVAFYPGSHV